MDGIWAFLSDPANQATLTWLGGGLATVAGAAWAVLRYFVSRPEEQPAKAARGTVRAERGGIAAGRDVTVRSSRGISGTQTVLLLLVVVGALALVAGLAGDRIAAVGSNVVGGDVKDSTITIGPASPAAKP